MAVYAVRRERGIWRWTLIAAALSSALVWWWHAAPLLTLGAAGYAFHDAHRLWLLAHVLGGSVALACGPWLLWSGLRRAAPRWHRFAGRAYLFGGGAGIGAGAVLAVIARHPPLGLSAAVFTLALAWFLAAGMAWRAIHNRRIDAHRDWVLRSYVLTASFVSCRLAMRLPLPDVLGAEQLTAVAWLSWVLPLLLTECALQWRRTGRQPVASPA